MSLIIGLEIIITVTTGASAKEDVAGAIPQLTTAFPKNWAIFMGGAPALSAGTPAAETGITAGGVVTQ